jgi:hypothetical protein
MFFEIWLSAEPRLFLETGQLSGFVSRTFPGLDLETGDTDRLVTTSQIIKENMFN